MLIEPSLVTTTIYRPNCSYHNFMTGSCEEFEFFFNFFFLILLRHHITLKIDSCNNAMAKKLCDFIWKSSFRCWNPAPALFSFFFPTYVVLGLWQYNVNTHKDFVYLLSAAQTVNNYYWLDRALCVHEMTYYSNGSVRCCFFLFYSFLMLLLLLLLSQYALLNQCFWNKLLQCYCSPKRHTLT